MILSFIVYCFGCLIAFGLVINMYIENEKELKKSETKYDPEYGYIAIATFCSWFTVVLFIYNYIKYNKEE
jgi:Na+/proline symporter